MTIRRSALIPAIPVLVLAMPLLAGEPPVPPAPDDDAVTTEAAVEEARSYSLVDLPAERVVRLTPLQARLREILLAERTRLAPLRAAGAEETDSQRRLEIQRRIQALKHDTELALLRAQAEHARQDGRIELAERIEAGLQRMAERERARQESRPDPSVQPAQPGARR